MKYTNETIDVDGKCFKRVTFDRCTFVYRGLDDVVFRECRFIEPSFVFDGPAANTLAFLRGMYQDGFREYVEKSLQNRSDRVNSSLH